MTKKEFQIQRSLGTVWNSKVILEYCLYCIDPDEEQIDPAEGENIAEYEIRGLDDINDICHFDPPYIKYMKIRVGDTYCTDYFRIYSVFQLAYFEGEERTKVFLDWIENHLPEV